MKKQGIIIAVVAFMLSGCISNYLPEELDSFDKDAVFTTQVYRPVLGRTTVFSDNFNTGNSTMPLTFTLVNVTKADGSPAPELTQHFPVRVWKTPYLGTEKSLSEIENKRTYENRSLLQVRAYSGEVVLWANALSSFVDCNPSEGYIFDVKAENSGGYKYYTGMKLIPEREMDYEPNPADSETGFIENDYVHPVEIKNIYAEGSSSFYNMLDVEDVRIYFQRDADNTSKEHTLTFRFLDKNYKPIDPKRFNQTKWDKLVHGFDMDLTDEYVRYKVAYPIPLSNIPTEYTTKEGEQAHTVFAYDRIGRNGRRISSHISFDFSIFKEGHWEILFVFTGGTPEFRDHV